MSTPFQYKGNVTLSFRVADLNASITWYEEVLGLKLLYRVDEMRWCELIGPSEEITVGLGQAETVPVGGGCVPVWGVADIAKARSALEAKKVRFDGPTQEVPGMVKLATFYDPDGNAWMFAQDLRAE